MRILAMDTATDGCSVALLTDEGLFGRFEDVGRGHAEKILQMVDETLCDAGVTLSNLDGLAASVGPGSFTGVRISVAVAQGLAFGAGLPVVAVTTLEALAQRTVQDGARQVLACLDARMGEVYWGWFQADAHRGVVACGAPAVGPAAAVSPPLDGPLRIVGPYHAVGRGLAAYPELLELPGLLMLPGAATRLPDARDMARLGAMRLRDGEGIDPAKLAPQYLRDKVALTEAERNVAAAAKAAS